MDSIRHLAARLRRFDRSLLGLLGVLLCAFLFAAAMSPSEAAVRSPARELGRAVDRVSVTPGNWSIVHFHAVGTSTGLPRGVLVRPNTWLARERCEVGAVFHLEENALELDLDVAVSGIEEVASLDVIPVVHTRRGPRHVIGWIERQASEIVTLTLRTEGESRAAGDAPTVESVETTREHPFHSADRGDWVPARDLCVGERVTLVHGGVGVIERLAHGGEGARVCNLQVAGEAEFAVGASGLVVHNDYDGWRQGNDVPQTRRAGRPGSPNHWSEDQQALLDIVGESKPKGMTRRDAETVMDWGDELGMRVWTDPPHNAPINFPHLHVGGGGSSVQHVPVR